MKATVTGPMARNHRPRGSYGIGPTGCAAIIEASHDDAGIVCRCAAPFEVR